MKIISYKKSENNSENDDKDYFYLKDLEDWKVIDIIRYNKNELQNKANCFL